MQQPLIVEPRIRDLSDGFQVRRLLPSAQRQMVGPFIFFDHFGPHQFSAGEGLDVRPHPHIGLATVTYLFAGEIVHRDSLGCEQTIRPGDVNWMLAARGIVHSERTAPDVRTRAHAVHGIQTWVALPRECEEDEPGFWHHPATSLPLIEREGVTLRVIAGEAFGERSPVATASPTLYVAAELQPGARLELVDAHAERAVYVAEGELALAQGSLGARQMALFVAGDAVVLEARVCSRALIFGGAPVDGQRYISWNFVSSSRERIAQAKRDWRERRFAPVPGDDEFIPLPE